MKHGTTCLNKNKLLLYFAIFTVVTVIAWIIGYTHVRNILDANYFNSISYVYINNRTAAETIMDTAHIRQPLLQCLLDESIFETSVSIKDTELYDRNDLQCRFKNALYLYSEGGSGNTWTRILLEFITNVGTGSPFGDDTFAGIFKFEGQCHDGLLLCKAHPRWFYYSLAGEFVRRPQGNWMLSTVQKRLNTTLLTANKKLSGTADGLVWLVRDPWKSMWSLYQLIYSDFHSHSKRIRKKDFDATLWRNEVWLGSHNEISLVEHWKQQFYTAYDMRENRSWSEEQIVMIQFEHLLDKHVRVNEMMRVLNHLYVLDYTKISGKFFALPTRTHGSAASAQQQRDTLTYLTLEELIHRIECAFNYSNIRFAQRVKHSHKQSDELFVSMHDAYKSLGVETLCNMWNSVRPLSKPFGYQQLFIEEFDCDKLNLTYAVVDNIGHANLTQKVQNMLYFKQHTHQH